MVISILFCVSVIRLIKYHKLGFFFSKYALTVFLVKLLEIKAH